MRLLKYKVERFGWLLLLLLWSVTTLKGQHAPDWTVNPGEFQFSMTMVASVRVDNVLSADAGDQVGVFVNDELRGTGKLSVEVPSSGALLAFIQVYSNEVSGEVLSFKIYDASADQVVDAVNAEVFEDGKKLGGNQEPYEVTNNTIPSAIQLSKDNFDENLSVGTQVAAFSNNDPDEEETHSYVLVSGEGDDHNSRFSIKGAALKTDVVFDYEELASLSFRVKVTDSKGAEYSQVLTMSVNDVNDAPTAINLDNDNIDENAALSSQVGALESEDQDAEDTHTYTLADGEGDTHNAFFQINGGSIVSQEIFDFEALSELSIRVRSTDETGDFFEQAFSIQVNDINDAPSGMSLSSTDINENAGSNAMIGTLSSQDEDAEDTHTYAFAEGEGDDDNAVFTLRNGGELFAIEDFDFETRSTYSIRLATTDNDGLAFSKTFEITVNDINEAPVAILLSNSSIDENSADGTVIGNLSSSDPDTGDNHQYTLIAGAGDEGNAAFSINDNDQLVAAEVFDFEQQTTYSVRIESMDAGGLTLAQAFTINVNNLNEGSTVIALSANSLAENNTVGDLIGDFSTTDPDNAETFTYALVAGDGDTDNASFDIDGSSLKAAAAFDHESQSSYSIRVRSTDSQSNELETIFSITVQDVNEAPTALALSNSTVEENQAESTSIGDLSTTDVDDGDSFVYSFVEGDGDTDNELFTIQNGNELLSTTSFDFETKSSFSVRIKSTDQAGESVASSFTLTITDVNDAPTEILLSQADLDENNAPGKVIGTFSSTDQDAGDTHTYSLTAGTGDEDNASFSINESGELLAGASFDFEQQPSYSIRVMSIDSEGATFAASFAIAINDMNEGSTVIALSANSLAENNTVGDAIGDFSTTDPDNAETFTYALVAGEGDTDNASFDIDGSSLKAGAAFDHESQSSYGIRVRSTDSQSNQLEAVFSITIQDVNEAPTALALSNSTIEENQAESASIGDLSTTDVDDGDSFVYSFVEGDGDTDNELFTIQNGNELLSTTSFDFETKSSFSVRIKSTDQAGESVASSFTLTITDVNDAPTEILLSQADLDENNAPGDVIGTFSSTDQDAGDTHTYSLTAGTGDEDNASFSINESGELLAGTSFDFEQQSSYSVRVTSTDSEGATFAVSFAIAINDMNESSTVIALSTNSLAENNTVGDAIGNFSTTDPDNAETFTYALVAGDGDTDNESFDIDGSSLKAGAAFDHESQSSYSIRVRSTDSQSNELETVFSITVQDVNEAPTALALSNSTVEENQAESASIGDLSTTDVDDGDSFVYSFVEGDGDDDNELFTIQNGSELLSTTSFNFETKSSFSVRIKSTDQAGESIASSFTLTITDVNDAPTEILLSQADLDENNDIGDVIGAFSSTDQDAGDTHTYSLTAGTGDEDNASFSINGNGELLAGTSFDFEQQSGYSIRVTSTDSEGAAFASVFNITINNVNEGATTISLSENRLAENSANGAVVGTFSTTDPDNAETFTYELVEGEGDTDNASFEIEGDMLKASRVLDYEEQETYSIRVRSTAISTGAIEVVFNVIVQDANDIPTDIALSGQSVNENNEDDHLIGQLSTTDQDAEDQHIYSLTSGTGDTHNGFFAIRNTNELVLTQSVDFETNQQLELRLVSIDNAGARLESAFVIEVGNLPEPSFSAESSVAFDPTGIGESATQNLAVSNSGPDGNLLITGVSVSGPFSVDMNTAEITPGMSVAFDITFSPLERGDFSGILTFQTNVGEKTVALTGSGELVTGLEDLPDFSDQVQVFPNPATSLLTIDVSVFNGQPVDLEMIGFSGYHLQHKEKQSTQSEIRVDVSRMPKGIYLLLLSSGTESARKKVIIK